MKHPPRIIAAVAVAAACAAVFAAAVPAAADPPVGLRTASPRRTPGSPSPFRTERGRRFYSGPGRFIRSTPQERARQAALNKKWHRAAGLVVRAKAFRVAGDLKKAVACLTEAASLNDKYVLAHTELAETYAAQGEWAEAAASYRRVIYACPGGLWRDDGVGVRNDFGHLARFATVLLNAGREREAQAVYDRAWRVAAPRRMAPYVYVPDGVHPLDPKKLKATLHLYLADEADSEMSGSNKVKREALRRRRTEQIRAALAAAPRFGPAHLMLAKTLEEESQTHEFLSGRSRYWSEERKGHDRKARELKARADLAQRRAWRLGAGDAVFAPPMHVPSTALLPR